MNDKTAKKFNKVVLAGIGLAVVGLGAAGFCFYKAIEAHNEYTKSEHAYNVMQLETYREKLKSDMLTAQDKQDAYNQYNKYPNIAVSAASYDAKLATKFGLPLLQKSLYTLCLGFSKATAIDDVVFEDARNTANSAIKSGRFTRKTLTNICK